MHIAYCTLPFILPSIVCMYIAYCTVTLILPSIVCMHNAYCTVPLILPSIVCMHIAYCTVPLILPSIVCMHNAYCTICSLPCLGLKQVLEFSYPGNLKIIDCSILIVILTFTRNNLSISVENILIRFKHFVFGTVHKRRRGGGCFKKMFL